MRKFPLTTKHTKATKDSKMIIFNVVRLVTSFENTCAKIRMKRLPESVIPAKAGIQANSAGTNLDSRVRGNDGSKRALCGGQSLYFHSPWASVSS